MIRLLVGIFFLNASFSQVTIAQNTSLTEDISYRYLDTLVKIAKANYPRVAQNQKQIDIANKNITKAKLSWFEALGFYILYNPYNSTSEINPGLVNRSPSGAQLGVTVNIGTVFQKPNLIKTTRLELDIAKLEHQEYLLNIEAVVKDRYFKYVEQVAIVRARSRSVLDVGILLSTIKSKFERGEDTFENYSKALVLYNDQNQLKINAESSMVSAKAFLEEILNKKLEEIH